MILIRHIVPMLIGSIWVGSVSAQQTSGTITGRVLDGTTQQPIASATVFVEGTQRTALTRTDGGFELTGVPAGSYRIRAARIGYGPQNQGVTVAAGAVATVQFALTQHIAVLEEVVVTGYGTQRREAITGSVATINAEAANVGVMPNVTGMIEGRAAGISITANNGEPGAGVQIRIRGGTSISASNEPLYVLDGVPIQNVSVEPGGIGIGGAPSLPRNPLNLLNPSDVASITILKDASATAIYGARAANGVILIETKRGAVGPATMEYDAYVAMASPARYLDVLNGSEYRAFIQQKVSDGTLPASALTALGQANTDWERAVTRTSVTTNHNVGFAGGTEQTRYRVSLNYLNQQGVVIANGLKRYQGRLNASHQALNDRLQLAINLNASHVLNDYLPYETEGGFEGGVFQNVAVFNPTRPIKTTNPATGQEVFFEEGIGRQSVRNPVALAEQIEDVGKTTRLLGNVTAELELLSGLSARLNVGADRSDGTRRAYYPRESPVGAEWQGRALQRNRDNTAVNLQTVLTFRREFGIHGLDVVGGYEFGEVTTAEFGAEARNFLTDAFSFNNLGGGNELIKPFSWTEESRLVSFFGRANYSLNDRYFLTGVLRRDGSSRFGAGKKWALFPAVSASWHISDEGFMGEGFISDLRLRAGWGLQGNPAVPPYASLILLEPSTRYVFGEVPVTGVAPVRNPNPDLKWEQTSQVNAAIDYGLLDDRLSGTIEYYVKNTSDLLLEVPVPQPAAVSSRLENIGKIRNRGLEASLDAQVLSGSSLTWVAGLVFTAERNEVVDLGGRQFISTGFVSGQGQSGQVSQRIMPGHSLGTFYGPEFVGVDAQGRQLFNKYTVQRDAQGRETSRQLTGQTTTPGGDDYVVIGNANPDFTLGLRSRGTVGKFDFSFLVRSEIGQDVFNNTALVYATTSNALQNKNFLSSARDDPTGIREPAIYSSRWIEDGTFARVENLTVGYTFELPGFTGPGRLARAYVSGDNLVLITGYSGYDPEAHSQLPGLAVRGVDYLNYPRPRTFTAGLRVAF